MQLKNNERSKLRLRLLNGSHKITLPVNAGNTAQINCRQLFLILHFCQYWIWWLLISNSTEQLPHKLTQYVCTIIMSQCYDNLLYIIIIGARVREVFPGSGRVLGIQVENNYITLPGEIFKDLNKSGTLLYTNIFPKYNQKKSL